MDFNFLHQNIETCIFFSTDSLKCAPMSWTTGRPWPGVGEGSAENVASHYACWKGPSPGKGEALLTGEIYEQTQGKWNLFLSEKVFHIHEDHCHHPTSPCLFQMKYSTMGSPFTLLSNRPHRLLTFSVQNTLEVVNITYLKNFNVMSTLSLIPCVAVSSWI